MRHSNCVFSAGVQGNQDSGLYRRATAVLETCRILRNEFKALSFARLTFVFASFDHFADFKAVITHYPVLRDNLTSIIVNGATIPRSALFSPPLRRPLSLPELQNLTIFYETPSYQHPHDLSNLLIDQLDPAHALGPRLASAAREFHGGKITNLKVCVAAKAKLSRYKVLDVEPEAFVRVSAEVEQALRAKNPA